MIQMRPFVLRWSWFAIVLHVIAHLLIGQSCVADSLAWNTNSNRVSADVKSLKLPKLLEQVATETGWLVFVEPGTTHNASAKFKDLQTGEALRLLLGDLNFALVPQTNSGPRLFVFRTSQGNATQLIRPDGLGKSTKPAGAIPNELIVRIKPGANIDEIARLLGAKVVGRLDGLNAYRLQFADEAAADAAYEKLKANSDVDSIEYNVAFDPPVTPQALDHAPVGPVSLKLAPSSDGDPCVPVIGMIDTKMQSSGPDLDAFILKQLSVAGEASVSGTSPTHATSMYQTMLRAISQASGGSSSAKFVVVDAYGASETTTSWNVALGVQAAVNNGANILNLSLGSASESAVLTDVIKQAIAKGIPVFAAAGNQPVKTPTYPAADLGVIAVTATQGSQLAPYANSGSFVDLALPGASVVYFGGQAYVVQGTSPATAYATGVEVSGAATVTGFKAVPSPCQSSPATRSINSQATPRRFFTGR
jgi:hypothetical protein